jgi:C-5 cytosine-specific DNA methylase.
MLHDNTAEPDIFSGKTCPEPYPADKATILHGWLQKWLASEMSSRPRTAGAAKGARLDFEVETFIVHGSQDPCVSGVTAFTVGRNQGAENVLVTSGAQYAVRRLTVLECERLQGFPDGWTLISAGIGSRCAADPDMRLYLARHAGLPQDDPSINKLAADGPRYKAIGNSMAVPVMRWIGGRIDGGDPDFEAGAPCFAMRLEGGSHPKDTKNESD